MRPAHMVAWISDIVNTQIVVILFSYLNVILTIARIGISHVVIVAEVVHRTCVEIPVGVIVPRFPFIVPVIPGDHPDTRQGCEIGRASCRERV